MKRWIAVLLLLLPTVAFAQVPKAILDLTGTTPGTHYYQVDLAPSGMMTIVEITQVIRPGKPSPDVDPEPVLSDVAKSMQQAALNVVGDPNRNRTAAELAGLFREVGKKVTSGAFKTEPTIFAVLKGAMDMHLNDRGVSAQWLPAREVLGTHWTALRQQGGTDADYVKLLNEAANGFDASVQSQTGQPIKVDIDIDKILKWIEIIMQILKLIPMTEPAVSFP